MLENQAQIAIETEQPSPPVTPKPAWRIGSNWWAWLLALGLAALYGRVTLLNLGYGVVGGDKDGYENLWNDYWVRLSLFQLHRNPFFTDYLYYPTGISLRYHTLNPLNGLFALPLWPLIGSVAATNLKFLLSIALTCFCAYLLFKDMLGAAVPAFAGAALFTFANDQMVGFYTYGQAEKLSQWWLPLYLWLMLRTLNRPRWVWWGAGAVLALVAMALTDWQFVLYAVLLTAGYALFDLIWRRKLDHFLKLAGIGVVWLAVVALPLLLPMLKDAADNPWLVVGDQADNRARSLSDFFGFGSGNPGYLALGVTVVGLVGWWRRGIARLERPNLVFWGLTALIASILTLGPHLKLTAADDKGTGLPLPYGWLGSLPVLNIGRDPGRYYLIALLGFGFLFGLALRELLPSVLQLLQRRVKLPVARLIAALLVGVILAVTLFGFVVQAGTAQLDPPDWPPFYYTLAQDKENYAILELPLFTEKGRGEDTYEAYQSIHGKQRFGGRLARDHKLTYPKNFSKLATLFRDFFWLDKPDIIQSYRPTAIADFLPTPDYNKLALPLLNFYKVRYIVLYLDALRETSPQALPAAEAQVQQALGAGVKPVYEDSKMKAYRVPEVSAAGQLFMDTGNGWYSAEKNPTRSYRWADAREGQPAQLLVFNLGQLPQTTKVQFTTLNFKSARTININFDEYPASSFKVEPNGTQDVVLDLNVPPGLHIISLSSPEPSLLTGLKGDARKLSFCLYDITWQTTSK